MLLFIVPFQGVFFRPFRCFHCRFHHVLAGNQTCFQRNYITEIPLLHQTERTIRCKGEFHFVPVVPRFLHAKRIPDQGRIKVYVFQCTFDIVRLCLQLSFVLPVLPYTAATLHKVRTGRFHPFFVRSDNFICICPPPLQPSCRHGNLDLFPGSVWGIVSFSFFKFPFSFSRHTSARRILCNPVRAPWPSSFQKSISFPLSMISF
jgi:hypothetical protein